MLKRLALLCTLGALAVPAAASAATIQVSGQQVLLAGRMMLRVELSATAGAKPVRLRARTAVMRFVDLGGDLRVSCGRRDAQRRHDADGHAVLVCAGAGRAVVSGTHFRIEGFALRYGIAIPDGYTGTVQGQVRPFQPRPWQPNGQGQGNGLGQASGQGSAQPSTGDASSTGGSTSIDAALAAALGN